MKKRLYTFGLIMSLMILACACGKKTEEASSEKEKTTAASETTAEQEEQEYKKVEIHSASQVDQVSAPEKGETIAVVKVKDMVR